MSMPTDEDFSKGVNTQVSTYALIGDRKSFTGIVLGVISSAAVPTTANASTNHTNQWPSIPDDVKDKVEDDYRSYDYLILKLEDESIMYLGLAWIDSASVSEITVRSAVVNLTNFNDANGKAVTEKLRLAGYTVTSVVITE